MPLQRMELGSIRFYHRRGLLTIVGRSMTLEEQSMKKSFGKKLLAGIVSASMILGIPVAGYSQEEDLSQLVIAQEETAEVTEEVLAGAGEVEVAAVETPADVAAVEETEVFSEVVSEVQEDLAERQQRYHLLRHSDIQKLLITEVRKARSLQ